MNLYLNPKRIVFLSWALIIFLGFLITHFYQHPNINYIWIGLSILGLGVMYKYMPFKVPVLKKTFYVWVGVILLGMFLSFLPFYILEFAELIGYLGVVWMLLMGIGFILNGLVYPMRAALFFAGGLNLMVGILTYFLPILLEYQYIIAAFIGGYGMVHLTFYAD